jgi:hypothetical protein
MCTWSCGYQHKNWDDISSCARYLCTSKSVGVSLFVQDKGD